MNNFTYTDNITGKDVQRTVSMIRIINFYIEFAREFLGEDCIGVVNPLQNRQWLKTDRFNYLINIQDLFYPDTIDGEEIERRVPLSEVTDFYKYFSTDGLDGIEAKGLKVNHLRLVQM